MTTYVYNKELFIEQMKKWLDDKRYIVLTTTPGTIKACSKKRQSKEISMHFASDVFDRLDTITDIMNSQVFGVVALDKKFLSKDMQNQIENFKGGEL